MKISTRGRYALRIMLDIAMNGDGEPVPIGDVSARQGISQKYLEQIASDLVRAGYLRSVRGACGGYLLVGSTEEIGVGGILAATEGPVRLVDCDGCPRSEGCLTAPLWRHIEGSVRRAVDGITLQSLIDGDLAHTADRPAVTVPAGHPKRRYAVLDRSDGMTIDISGNTLEECFADAGYALFDQTADLAEVGSSEEVEFTVSGADPEDRLQAFLSELMDIRDGEGIVLKEFDIRFDGDSVHCTARGEVPWPSAYRFGHDIRAVDRVRIGIGDADVRTVLRFRSFNYQRCICSLQFAVIVAS